MRNAAKRCEPLLTTLSEPLEKMSIVKESKIEAIKNVVKNMFNLDLLEVKIAKEKEEERVLSQDETIELFESEMKKYRDGSRNERQQDDPQSIVKEEDLPTYLKDGWQFVSVLPSQNSD